MVIDRLVVGSYAANCFLVYDETSDNEAIIIDPGAEAERIYQKIKDKNCKVKSIILTHGHGDHIGAVEQLKKLTGAEVMIHPDDEEMLRDVKANLTNTMNGPDVSIKVDRTIGDGDVIEFGHIKADILHTPGHTQGGICIYFEDQQTLVTGDTLFYGSIGRTDLYGGNHRQLINSILQKLMPLDDDTVVYPGHGSSTTIGFERRKNPFIQG